MKVPDFRDSTSTDSVIKLQDQHRMICRLRLLGHSKVDIARVVGCSYLTVIKILDSSAAKDYLNQLNEEADIQTVEIAQEIHKAAVEGVEYLHAVAAGHAPDVKVKERIDVALELLRMDGYSPPKRVEIDARVGYMERTGMNEIGDQIRHLREQNIIDVTPGPSGRLQVIEDVAVSNQKVNCDDFEL